MKNNLGLAITGHVLVQDDLGQTLLDEFNAVHPQNMARVIARSLANEFNYNIHRIAFGNGGTQVDAAFTITYNPPNDGQPPDTRTWDSRIYNETYSEIIDEGSISLNPDLGTDPGSAGPNAGSRPGGGAFPSGDPASVPHVSGPGVHSDELGLSSRIVITSVLNPNEPAGQLDDDINPPSEDSESSFAFDEIGLYTTGAPAIDSNGSQDIDVGDRKSDDDSGLLANTQYSINVEIDGGGIQQIDFTTPIAGGSGAGGQILYGDICQSINTGDVGWNPAWGGANPLPGGATIAITDVTSSFPSITGAQTFGYLRVTSGSVGAGSTVVLTGGILGFDLITNLNPPTGGIVQAARDGMDAGVQNDPINPDTERERLLTHIIFSPVLKAANRTLTVTYTLTVSVARTIT